MKFYIETYGCTANQGDSMRIKAQLIKDGHERVEVQEEADTVVVNTCIVTRRTELNVTKRIYELEMMGKNLIIAGCLPAARYDLISGKENIETLTPKSLDTLFDYGVCGVIGTVNISNGCVGDCSYCIVKKARGDLLSYTPERIAGSVRMLVDDGAREVRITSQDCSAYGLDGGMRLPELTSKITSIDGDFQIRIGMMNPFTLCDILDETIDAFSNPKVFKFLHVPVQSGSDKILKLMNRNYRVSDFIEIVRAFRKRFSDITLSTDFIIGFPSETEEDFNESIDLLKKLEPEKVNITRFSPRPYTKASYMEDILERTKKERSRTFTKIYHEIASDKNSEWVGRILDVIVTESGEKGGVISRDGTYKHIVIKEDISPGERCKVRITEARRTYLVGCVVEL